MTALFRPTRGILEPPATEAGFSATMKFPQECFASKPPESPMENASSRP
jgi:hypothetical protein